MLAGFIHTPGIGWHVPGVDTAPTPAKRAEGLVALAAHERIGVCPAYIRLHDDETLRLDDDGQVEW